LSRPASLLLLPYVLWVCFSAGINFTIWVLNSGYDFSQAQ
jgi:tryptophan-rich sensory protein